MTGRPCTVMPGVCSLGRCDWCHCLVRGFPGGTAGVTSVCECVVVWRCDETVLANTEASSMTCVHSVYDPLGSCHVIDWVALWMRLCTW